MKDKRFELLSVEEMRKQYGLRAQNRPVIHLDSMNVPEKLQHLIPYAELWGVGDDLILDDMVKTASPHALEELKRLVRDHDDLLDEWLAGPEADSTSPSEEYLAFTAMRMAADLA